MHLTLCCSLDEPPRNEEEDSSDCESTADISELIFVPQNQNSLQQMYESIKQCQALNPDSDDLADDSEEDNIYEDAEEIEEEQFYDGRNVNDAGNNNSNQKSTCYLHRLTILS